MLELILKGRPRFYLWLCFLGAIFGLGFIVYIFQANIGLAITGMSQSHHMQIVPFSNGHNKLNRFCLFIQRNYYIIS